MQLFGSTGKNRCKERGNSLLSEYTESLGAAALRRKTAIALRAAKVEAELASRTKSEFIANMSHELRTPLNAIIGFSDMMCHMDNLPREQVVEYSTHIKTAAEHLLELINSILDASKVQAGKLVIDPEDIELDEVVESCKTIISPKAREKEILLEWDIPSDLPLLFADPMRVRQVMLNVLSNAVKFTPPGGRIDVTACLTADGSMVEVTVMDSGPGMTPDEIDIAMTPFGQVNSTINKKHEGTGLGLPLSAALIRLHKGKLTIAGRKGRGLRVSFTLPVSAPSSSHAHGGGADAAISNNNNQPS